MDIILEIATFTQKYLCTVHIFFQYSVFISMAMLVHWETVTNLLLVIYIQVLLGA